MDFATVRSGRRYLSCHGELNKSIGEIMFNPKMFQSQPIEPNVFGPIRVGSEDVVTSFGTKFRMKYNKRAGCFLVGRKDGKVGCFSVKDGEIGFYLDTPKEVWEYLNGGEFRDAMFVDPDSRHKYMCLDMIGLLREHDIPI